MKYYVLTGKRSADVHVAQLIEALRAVDSMAQVRCWAGDQAAAAGGEVVRNYDDMAGDAPERWLGLSGSSRRVCQAFREELIAWQPDTVILVDFDGLNFRLPRVAQEIGIRVYGYISPRPWAWNTRRVQTVREFVDRMFVTIPFEEAFYEAQQCPATYVGHPNHEAAKQFQPNPAFHVENGLDDRPIIAALPGSSAHEVGRSLHFMLSILPPFMNYQFVVAGRSSVPRECYEPYRRNNIKIIYDQTFDLLCRARAAMVSPGLVSTSDDRPGAASLECALFDVPQVICYRNSYPTYLAVRTMAKVRYLSLVNLIAEREVVKELLQENFRPADLMKELELLLHDHHHRAEVRAGYAEVRELLGPPVASQRVAAALQELLRTPVASRL
ncbi:MAG: lipid-A-disaccharide synthase [Catalinimonas sp.]